jgi:predicted exporter
MNWLWLLVASILAAVVYLRLDLSFDLSAFVPRQTTLSQEILIEQIRRGPASRLLVIGIGGESSDDLVNASDQLKRQLSGNPAFVTVMNGEFEADVATVPAPVDQYYLLMRDVDYSAESLRSALQSRLRDLAFGGGTTLRELIARDPFLVTVEVLEQLSPAEVSGDMWFSEDGSAVLMAETVPTSIDIEAQSAAISSIKAAFHELPDSEDLTLDITGVGAFSVELQQTIRAEATVRSLLASISLMLVILVVFRRPRYLLLAALPLGMGFLAGLALVSLLFDKVHGITLAFGFTMLGVAIDYPLHLFSHARNCAGPMAIRRIWPTMRLGVTSTAIAYLALVFSGSQGLAQLGGFTATGIIVAMLVTRTWLPHWVSGEQESSTAHAAAAKPPALTWSVGLFALIISAVVIWQSATSALWDDNLSSLSPISAKRLSADRHFRSATATPDMRYQLVLQGGSIDMLLEDCERVEPLLAAAREDGLITGWQSICLLLPSPEVQENRRRAIPEPGSLRERIRLAVADTPFRAEAFEPFVDIASMSRQLEPLQHARMRETPLRSWLDAHLLKLDSEWVALVSLVEPDPDLLKARVAEWPVSVDFLDLQNASLELMRDYRVSATLVIAVSALLILLLLWLVRGEFRQMLWIGLTVAAALGTTMAVTSLIHGALTVMHLIAMLLVLGLGLDYALFLSRSESADEQAGTLKGVTACAASTILAFGILAGSSIPVLKYIGLTVATGSATSYLLAYFGSRGKRQKIS